MSDPIVVIGLDGLDVKKAKRWQPELLLEKHQELDLKEFDHLLTYFIWPTMFTGETPMERGFPMPYEGREQGETKWEKDWLQSSARISRKLIPNGLREWLGSHIENSAIDSTPDMPSRDLFEGETIFDDVRSKVIEVPGWNKGELDIAINDVPSWNVLLEDNGVQRAWELVDEQLRDTSAEAKTALDYPYDLIWVHIHSLDVIGHTFDEEVEEEWYEKVWIEIEELVDTDLARFTMVLSDHGHKDGDHREPGLVCIDDSELGPLPQQPRDVYTFLETHLRNDADAIEERMQTLRDLGYRDVPEKE